MRESEGTKAQKRYLTLHLGENDTRVGLSYRQDLSLDKRNQICACCDAWTNVLHFCLGMGEKTSHLPYPNEENVEQLEHQSTKSNELKLHQTMAIRNSNQLLEDDTLYI